MNEYYCEACGKFVTFGDGDGHKCRFSARRHAGGELFRMLIAAILAILFVAAVMLLTGCSAKARIGDAAAQVQGKATSAINHIDAATATGDVGPLAQPHLDDAKADIGEISEAAAAITEALPGVVDKEWAGWFWIKLLIILAFLAVIGFYVWRFWPFIQVAIGWIPGVFRQRAKVAVDFVADPTPTTDADIETVRAIDKAKRDPRFDAAFKAEATARGVVV